MDGQEGGCMSLEVYYRRCLVVCGVVFGVCVVSVVEGGGVWNRVGVPLTLWRPPVTRCVDLYTSVCQNQSMYLLPSIYACVGGRGHLWHHGIPPQVHLLIR